MEKEMKYYGIVMKRQFLTAEMQLYHPQAVASGTIVERKSKKYLRKEDGSRYLLSESAKINVVEYLTVSYLLSEEELLERYETFNVNDAMKSFLEEMMGKLHLGFVSSDGKFWQFQSYDVNDLVNRESSRISYRQFFPRKRLDDSYDKELLGEFLQHHSGEDVIFISRGQLDDILNNASPNDIRKKIEALCIQQEELHQHFYRSEASQSLLQPPIFPFQKVKSDSLLCYFDQVCVTIRLSKSLEQATLISNSFKETLLEIFQILSSRDDGNEELDVVCEFLYNLSEEFDLMMSSNDLECIHMDVLETQKNARNDMRKASILYDRYETMERTERVKTKEKKKTTRAPKEKGTDYLPHALNARAMKSFFDDRIIGQEEAKRIVIMATIFNQLADNPTDRTSCLLVGPTGSGKTLLAETVRDYLELPIDIIDTTQLTISGYIGDKIEPHLIRLLEQANGDLELAERGIVVLDELDKKGSSKNSDVSGKGVLNMLLPFIQGTDYTLKYDGKEIIFNTSRLTIFATGAFTDVVKGKQERGITAGYKGTRLGFGANLQEKEEEDISYPTLEPDDFIKYGNMTSEIMGRLSTIAQLSGHTKESLKSILVESLTSPLLGAKKMFEKLFVTLYWTEGYLDAISERALKLKTGARSLKSTVDDSIAKAKWHVLINMGEYCGIILKKETVWDASDCLLIDQQGNTHSLKELEEKEFEQRCSTQAQKQKKLELPPHLKEKIE